MISLAVWHGWPHLFQRTDSLTTAIYCSHQTIAITKVKQIEENMAQSVTSRGLEVSLFVIVIENHVLRGSGQYPSTT